LRGYLGKFCSVKEGLTALSTRKAAGISSIATVHRSSIVLNTIVLTEFAAFSITSLVKIDSLLPHPHAIEIHAVKLQ
jgi:hypothetical protein